MTRSSFGVINPNTTSGTALAQMLSDRNAAENSGHVGSLRPSYAVEGMIYTENSTGTLKLMMAVGTVGPDIDMTALFAPPPGTLRTTAGARLIPGWLWCDGSGVPRVTYSALFEAICPSFNGTTTSGSPTVTAVSEDLTKCGLIGAIIEGLNIPGSPPARITAVTPTTMTLSVNASASGTVTLRACPHGNGNGSTTFNVPDCRGRVIIGRGNMGDAILDSGLVTLAGSGLDGTKLGNSGGAQNFAIGIPNLPPHTHQAGTNINSAGSSSGSFNTDAATSGAHTHTFSDTSSGATPATHTHGPPAGSTAFMSDVPDPSGTVTVGTGTRAKMLQPTAAAGAHTHTISGTTSGPSAATHTHSLSNMTFTTTVQSGPAAAISTPIGSIQPSLIENVVIKI